MMMDDSHKLEDKAGMQFAFKAYSAVSLFGIPLSLSGPLQALGILTLK